MFILLALLATNNASAYYCPATGQWLSRDPNGESGFETLRATSIIPKVGRIAGNASLPPSRLAKRDPITTKVEPNRYEFVHNDALNKSDLLGLCGCGCGPDISQAIDKLLLDVDNTYNSWNDEQQCKACDQLESIFHLADEWDINAFAPGLGYPGQNTKCLCDSGFTYTYRGKCYFAGSLNYLLFGRAMNLCGNDLETAENDTTLWKSWAYGEDPDGLYASQAVAMVDAGFNGGNPAAGSNLLACNPSKTKINLQLDWTWLPNKQGKPLQ